MTTRANYQVFGALACTILVLFASCAALEILFPSDTDAVIDNPADDSQDEEPSPRPSAPSGLTADTLTAFTVVLWWGALPSGVESMLVVILSSGEEWSPEDGRAYTVGESVGAAGKVLCSGTLEGVSATGLSIGQACRFLVFAANASLEYSPASPIEATVPEPAPRFAGFDFSLQEGDFWEYRYYYSIYADWGNTNWSYSRNFVVMLGEPTAVGGRTAYPVTLQSVSNKFEPRWRWLALEDSVLYGSLYAVGSGDPAVATWTTIFDGRTGYWKGGGYFITRGEDDYSQASQSTERVGGEYRTVIKIGSGSSTQATYTYVPDYGYVASGEDLNYSTAEYFILGVGPGGYNEAFSLYSSDYQSSETEHVTLVASSLESTVPRDFSAKYWYSQGSIGIARSTLVGPGLGGLQHEADALASPPVDTETSFFVLGSEREELWRILEACEPEWQVSGVARGLDLGDLVKPGAASEGISFHAEGHDWSLNSSATGYLPVKEYLLSLAP